MKFVNILKAFSACSRENARYDRLIVAAPCSKRKRLVTKDGKKGARKRLTVFIPRTRQRYFFERLFEDEMMVMISSVAVENFEPFGKASCSQHLFAAIPCEI